MFWSPFRKNFIRVRESEREKLICGSDFFPVMSEFQCSHGSGHLISSVVLKTMFALAFVTSVLKKLINFEFEFSSWDMSVSEILQKVRDLIGSKKPDEFFVTLSLDLEKERVIYTVDVGKDRAVADLGLDDVIPFETEFNKLISDLGYSCGVASDTVGFRVWRCVRSEKL